MKTVDPEKQGTKERDVKKRDLENVEALKGRNVKHFICMIMRKR